MASLGKGDEPLDGPRSKQRAHRGKVIQGAQRVLPLTLVRAPTLVLRAVLGKELVRLRRYVQPVDPQTV